MCLRWVHLVGFEGGGSSRAAQGKLASIAFALCCLATLCLNEEQAAEAEHCKYNGLVKSIGNVQKREREAAKLKRLGKCATAPLGRRRVQCWHGAPVRSHDGQPRNWEASHVKNHLGTGTAHGFGPWF